jgi:hypothetical protein
MMTTLRDQFLISRLLLAGSLKNSFTVGQDPGESEAGKGQASS